MDGVGVSASSRGMVVVVDGDAAEGRDDDDDDDVDVDGTCSFDTLIAATGRGAEDSESETLSLMGDDGMEDKSAALNVSLEEAWCGRRCC